MRVVIRQVAQLRSRLGPRARPRGANEDGIACARFRDGISRL